MPLATNDYTIIAHLYLRDRDAIEYMLLESALWHTQGLHAADCAELLLLQGFVELLGQDASLGDILPLSAEDKQRLSEIEEALTEFGQSSTLTRVVDISFSSNQEGSEMFEAIRRELSQASNVPLLSDEQVAEGAFYFGFKRFVQALQTARQSESRIIN